MGLSEGRDDRLGIDLAQGWSPVSISLHNTISQLTSTGKEKDTMKRMICTATLVSMMFAFLILAGGAAWSSTTLLNEDFSSGDTGWVKTDPGLWTAGGGLY